MPLENEPNVLDLFNLRGRVAVVTGAGGYLGGSMARALAEAGARVVATSREKERAESLASSLADPNGVHHFGVQCNQTDADSVERCMDAVIQRTERIDVL